jgi:hypothetical protein
LIVSVMGDGVVVRKISERGFESIEIAIELYKK